MMLSHGQSAAAMASQGSRLRSAVGITISFILVWLPTTCAGGFMAAGVGGRRPVEYSSFQDSVTLQRQEGCIPMGVSQLVNSPNEKYGLAQAIMCPDRQFSPWNVSFVFGVSTNKPVTLDLSLKNWTWTVPVEFQQPTNSCALRFTDDGDLQLVVPINPMDPLPWSQSRVLWSSNTSGLGAVEIQVQDNGNLVLVHEDGKSVVWKALDIPVLPLLPLSEAATSTTGYLRTAMSAVLVAHVLPFLISCL
ncbi:hypothetical protein MPTK1_4g03640 [Marchantia polymorpha subsp. ruderalis]|uniref:Bulb-type lectin domain-containing protein n=2 Tax=Marchantia polymorpha TaxID=3197 RepID=A0AAF6B5X6_MARPO|nr:hypothetical protein MARPO_0044s0109 [Marchantia polymorpha]PTQ39692.1 hypothetical protein MARPO_0044s0109 [Marchantia polymorpha]BBN07409.1 hypothetical protein Mp_4g03640 [Marchantia polymorpha subsp. ruderalis]BBN07410.1 hypothetical protein Mp_4g03640 [Marchantia polymorpha subsp. ruderalis]|eukprot:PTQ39691.1 hypothetical protein MARPO_0044s0109 [Marchantia polymorpha]